MRIGAGWAPRGRAVPRYFSLPVIVALLCGAGAASAQSAADKATARQAATEAIKLYNEGNFADALDRMRRAQALYDAPVHLLYIARAQVKLGQLVEAAENYRLLARHPLTPASPVVFVNAVEEGRAELAELEPKIPTLRLVVEPANLEGVELEIDDKPVAAAIIGIDRPINPGQHRIVVKAPGHETAETTLEVAEAKPESLTVTLKPEPGAIDGVTSEGSPAKADIVPRQGQIGFMAGLRLGLSLPAGTLQTEGGGEGGGYAMPDFFRAGAGVELHGGVRFAEYFTGVIFGNLHGFSPGDGVPTPPTVTFENTGSAVGLGLGLIVGSPRRPTLGWFGEIDLLAYHAFQMTSSVEGSDCKVNWRWQSPAIRFGGGVVVPLGSSINLTPLGMLTIGQFGTRTIEYSEGCPGWVNFPAEGDVDLGDRDQKATHALLFFGVGGDFVFGRDKPQ